MKRKRLGYIVLYAMETDYLFFLMGASDIEGGLQACPEAPLIFPTREDAQRAIRIQAAAEKLNAVQGKPTNDDFLGGRKQLKIVPVYAAELPGT